MLKSDCEAPLCKRPVRIKGPSPQKAKWNEIWKKSCFSGVHGFVLALHKWGSFCTLEKYLYDNGDDGIMLQLWLLHVNRCKLGIKNVYYG